MEKRSYYKKINSSKMNANIEMERAERESQEYSSFLILEKFLMLDKNGSKIKSDEQIRVCVCEGHVSAYFISIFKHRNRR